jgi:hypothetical protein
MATGSLRDLDVGGRSDFLLLRDPLGSRTRQVAVERDLLVHAEEAGVGFDVALRVDRRAEQVRRHVFDGAEVAEVDAGFFRDLFQRIAGVLARGANDGADALVRAPEAVGGDEIGIVVGDDAQEGCVAAGSARVGVVPWNLRRAADVRSSFRRPGAEAVSSVGWVGLVSSLATPLILLSETEGQSSHWTYRSALRPPP